MSKTVRKNGEYLFIVWSGDNPQFEAVYGHVTRRKFIISVCEEKGVLPRDVPSQTEHTYARSIPSQTEDYDMEFLIGYKKGSGAMPVTIGRYPK